MCCFNNTKKRSQGVKTVYSWTMQVYAPSLMQMTMRDEASSSRSREVCRRRTTSLLFLHVSERLSFLHLFFFLLRLPYLFDACKKKLCLYMCNSRQVEKSLTRETDILKMIIRFDVDFKSRLQVSIKVDRKRE